MVTFQPVLHQSDFNQIEVLANTIWRDHYIPIIGKAQVDYMLEKFQSAKAISEQVDNGFEYFTIIYETLPVGYLSIKKEPETLFLSKIYVLKSYRGKQIGKKALNFIEAKAGNYQLKSISLTVNKNNVNAFNSYLKMGFENKGSVVMDIGNGFVMDDYQMIKKVAK
ncbi:GNAT family N-acetyltransferase [Flavobacteriaceae bacterium XHP0103]|uniref:GNAT family N-acetyltransferase n=1 Tax=Marixanthotalea marina TaxID=2844359 RepID=UPI002989FF93|nr:GNAT family N-acetyltransferase [Marixanthotalea marina]MBU3822826.1 GNAT family N-acetyltransferase [Marixanthotalea marina]